MKVTYPRLSAWWQESFDSKEARQKAPGCLGQRGGLDPIEASPMTLPPGVLDKCREEQPECWVVNLRSGKHGSSISEPIGRAQGRHRDL